MNHRERLLALQSLLDAHRAMWRPQPFHVRRPAWCDEWPALDAALRALDDATLARFTEDPAAAQAWLAPQLPVLATLASLCDLPPLEPRPLPPCDVRFDGSIPGRKRAQIEAFVAHGPAARAPLVEWCAGKGHLGRRYALADDVPVSALEIDPALCEEGVRLAARTGVAQTVICTDVLDGPPRPRVHGRSVVALHACGELHRTLVRSAARDGASSYQIAPCCYHLGVHEHYRPLSRDADLVLDAAALRLAVTETVTAPRGARHRLARDQAWKLGFIALRDALEGEALRPFKPVPARWLSGEFADFCRALAQREGLRLPDRVDWAHWLAVGERRRDVVRRLELVRHAFRRALEIWLVTDLACGLVEAGFAVRLGTFCARSLTPRNVLVLAERRHA
ncbi:MAG TPA: methyltransferase [Rhodocyclaceae bacterium]|nr:methyltransferase [Rhodocyclaceae bacterium]